MPTRFIGSRVEVDCADARIRVIDPVTGEIVADHPVVTPGEASVLDEHYPSPRPTTPRRAILPRTAAEHAFCALGPAAESFIAGAAAAGATRLAGDLPILNDLTAAHGTEAMVAALERATAFGRWRADDVRSIGAGRSRPAPGDSRRDRPRHRPADRPSARPRRLRHHHADCRGYPMTAVKAPVLAPDLEAGPKRLKLAAMRRVAPELLVTAKTQRWTPEEFLRTLVDAEITSRDSSMTQARLKAASFPVVKTFDEFDVAASSIPAGTIDYLASLEWITARENLALIGPAGTGTSHVLVASAVAAVNAGSKVR